MTLWGFLLWWLIDWFRVSNLVKNYNKDMSIELLKNFAWVSKKESSNSEESSGIKEWLKVNPSASLNDLYRLKIN